MRASDPRSRAELDSLWWDPGWTEAGADIFAERVRPVVAEPRWVLDGNDYSVGADSIIVFALRAHPKYNRRYEPLVGDPSTAHLDWVRLRSPRAARRWLRDIEAR